MKYERIPFSEQEKAALSALAKKQNLDFVELVRQIAVEAVTRRATTILDVAKAAKVSTATVSCAMRGTLDSDGNAKAGSQRVPADTVGRIRDIAKKMNWKPRLSANMRRQKKA